MQRNFVVSNWMNLIANTLILFVLSSLYFYTIGIIAKNIKRTERKERRIRKKHPKKALIVLPIAGLVFVALFLFIDVDGDGLNNLTELNDHTALFNSDTDSDGLNDGVEVQEYHTDPLDSDCDKDHIIDGFEITLGTDPTKADSDNDGLDDNAELYTYHTDPLDSDCDNDGLLDGDEVRLHTNLFDADTDKDGYPDGNDQHPTTHEWKLMDSDGDGWNDYTEFYEQETDRFNSDTDGDGVTDSSDPHPTEHEWKYQDSDNDGWDDYTEYYETHTNRFNSDSDGDGAPDSKDANPLSAARKITKTYQWKYPNEWFNAVTRTLTILVSSDLYTYRSQLPRIYDKLNYYKYTDDAVIAQIASELKTMADNIGFSYYDTANFILSFVQSVSYTKDDDTTGVNEFPRYPIETLVDGGGDCEDTSILFAGIMKELRYGVCLLSLPGHMAVGILGSDTYPGTYYTYEGNHYYFCETTGSGWSMGEMPSSLQGQSATIIEIK